MSSADSRTASEASVPSTPTSKERPLSLVALSFSEQLNDVFLLDNTLDQLEHQVEEKRFSLTAHNVELTALQERLKRAEKLLKKQQKRLSLPSGAENVDDDNDEDEDDDDEQFDLENDDQKEEEKEQEKTIEKAEVVDEKPEPVPEPIKQLHQEPPSPPPTATEEKEIVGAEPEVTRNPINSDEEDNEGESRTKRRLRKRMQNYSISNRDAFGLMGSYIPPAIVVPEVAKKLDSLSPIVKEYAVKEYVVLEKASTVVGQ